MCRDIERRDVDEVQIPGNKSESPWPFLDTLRYDTEYKRNGTANIFIAFEP